MVNPLEKLKPSNAGFGGDDYGKRAYGMVSEQAKEIEELQYKVNELVDFVNKLKKATE